MAVPQQQQADSRITVTLSEIAHGRTDNGRPLAAEIARQKAREALSAAGVDWDGVLKTRKEPPR
jgi:hypothetical protein